MKEVCWGNDIWGCPNCPSDWDIKWYVKLDFLQFVLTSLDFKSNDLPLLDPEISITVNLIELGIAFTVQKLVHRRVSKFFTIQYCNILCEITQYSSVLSFGIFYT